MWLPASLAVTFLVLSIYAFLDVTGDGRVQAETPWPFIPALLFATWSLLSIMGWAKLSQREKVIRLCLISLSILVVNGYTGSRGVGVAQLVVLFVFLAAGISKRYKGSLPAGREISGAILLGFLLFGCHQALTANGALYRLGYISHLGLQLASESDERSVDAGSKKTLNLGGEAKGSAIDKAAPWAPDGVVEGASGDQAGRFNNSDTTSQISPDASINVRIEMWRASLSEIAKAPIFGHGALSLKRIIQDRFALQHNHNQYLTWLVTGGIILLFIGISFLLAPYLLSVGLQPPDRLVIFLSISALWGIAMFFDSFFSLKFYLHYYCLLIGFLAPLPFSLKMK
jgi:hypothetical protein